MHAVRRKPLSVRPVNGKRTSDTSTTSMEIYTMNNFMISQGSRAVAVMKIANGYLLSVTTPDDMNPRHDEHSVYVADGAAMLRVVARLMGDVDEVDEKARDYMAEDDSIEDDSVRTMLALAKQAKERNPELASLIDDAVAAELGHEYA
jgi:hypothetical protein